MINITMNTTDVFEFTNYRDFIRAYAEAVGKTEGKEKKSGELRRIADAARIFPSYLSLVLAEKRELTLDQGILVADHCELDERERDFFLHSIQYARAGSIRLKTELSRKMDKMKAEHLELAKRLPTHKKFSIEDAAQFYSSWLPIAIRLFTAIPKYQTLSALSTKLGMNEKQVKGIMDFLIRTGLCIRNKDGRYGYGPSHTHLPAEHPLITKHHSNWRVRAMEKHALLDPSHELAYSVVLALSKSDSLKIRSLLPKWIEEVRAISDPSPSEIVHCLNIDWFEV